MTSEGGKGGGVIFKTDGNGENLQVMYEFLETAGSYPSNTVLYEAPNGKLYGTTYSGGACNQGIIFEFDPVTAEYITKVHFDKINLGGEPSGELFLDSNGKFYGTCNKGGFNDAGTLFEYDYINNTCINIYDFNSATGENPIGGLVKAANGNLYGVTFGGGINNFGTIFEYNPSTDTYLKLFDFSTPDGRYPSGTLLLLWNDLYGTTVSGGASYKGVVFRFNIISGIFTKLFDFDGTANGDEPRGALMMASDGKIYGTSCKGGSNNHGVIFEYDTATSTLTKKADLSGTLTGSYPHGKLIEASNGLLYGLASNGGDTDCGTIFEFNTTSGICTKTADFDAQNNGKNLMPH